MSTDKKHSFNKTLNYLKAENENYIKDKERLESELDKKRDYIRSINHSLISTINLDALPLEDISSLITATKFQLSPETETILQLAYKKKKPFKNTILNDIDFLDKNTLIKLDELLSYYNKKYLPPYFDLNDSSKFDFNECKKIDDEKEKIISFLESHNYLKRHYHLHCPKCSSPITILKEPDIEKIEKFLYFSKLIDDKQDDKLTEKEWMEYHEMSTEDYLFNLECDDCLTPYSFYSKDSIDSILHNCSIIYHVDMPK